MKEETPIEFDAETITVIEDWLERVLPMYAVECEGKIRADAYDSLAERVRSGESPEDALKSLRSPWRVYITPDTRYLSRWDVRKLRGYGKTIRKDVYYGINFLATIVLLAVGTLLEYAVVENTIPVITMLTAPIVSIVVLGAIILIWYRWIVRTIMEHLGTLAFPLLVAFEFCWMSPIIMSPLVVIALAGATGLYGSMQQAAFAGGMFTQIVLAALFMGCPLYLFHRARIRNNYELATGLLGLPEYSIGESDV